MSLSSQEPMTLLPPGARAAYQAFLQPPRERGPLPFWFWNGRLDETELLLQLERIERAGCAGAIIYPRHGLRTPYLSPEWMRLVGAVAGEARRRGVQIWLADSENWPGAVGIDPGEACFLKVTCIRNAASQTFRMEGQIIAAGALRRGHEASSIRGLTPDSGEVRWEPPDQAVWDLLIFSIHRYAHRDLLADGSGSRLIASTHARYEQALGSLRAAGIFGFFSDEIAPLSVWNVPDEGCLPWTPALARELQDDEGLLHALLPLALETPDASQRRQRFWQRISDRLQREFYQPVREWLEERGLEWGGHLLFDEPLLAQASVHGDFPAAVRSLARPAVDNLRFDAPGPEINLVSSIAHQSSRDATVESFGGAGWGIGLAERRRLFDLQLARGADRLIPHGLFYSSAGKRKLENPPTEFFREPFSPEYGFFSEHVRRMSALFAMGRRTPRVALLYPLRSAWAALSLIDEPDLARAVEDDFYRITRLLDAVHYEYELVDEAALEDAEVDGRHLVIGGARLPILILPSCPTLSRAAWNRIRELLENGGGVLCLGMLPEGFEDGPDPALELELQRLAAVEVPLVKQAYLLLQRSGVAGQEVYSFNRRGPEGGKFVAFQYGLSPDPVFALGEVRQILSASVPPDLECRDEQLIYRRRSMGGMDLYWVVSTAEETRDVRLAFRSHGAPEIWNTLTGAREPILQFTWVEADTTVAHLRLRPSEGVLIAVPFEEAPHVDAASFVVESVEPIGSSVEIRGYDDPAGVVKASARLTGPPQALWKRGREQVLLQGEAARSLTPLELDSGWQITRSDPNVLVLEEWRYRRDERGGGRILQWHRRLHPDWDVLPDRKPLRWFPELEDLEENRSAYVWYQTAFVVQEWSAGRALSLILEAVDAVFRCWVDGEEVEVPAPAAGAAGAAANPVLTDPLFHRIDLSGRVSTGHHSVTLLADYRGVEAVQASNRQRIPIDLVPARARLMGDYGVLQRPRGPAITARTPGADEKTAASLMPHYSGEIVCRSEVTAPADYVDCRLFLEVETRFSTVSVYVNGGLVRTLPWPPFRLDVSGLLRPGCPAALQIVLHNTSAPALLGIPPPADPLVKARLIAYPRVKVDG